MSAPCPWDWLEPQIDLVPFCEQRLCSWVVEPSNSWTNIGYLIVAFLIYKKKLADPESNRLFFRSALLIGLGSFFFHATGSVWGKIADVSAMFVLSVGLLSLALRKLKSLSVRQTEVFFFSMLAVSIAFLVAFRFGNILFGAQIFATLGIEILLFRRKQSQLDKRRLIISLAVFVVAFTLWVLDKGKILCHPDNHILSGHGVWHLLTAFAIYLVYLAYARPTRQS